MHLRFILYYFLFISVISVLACVFDKLQAKRDGWRIKESTLLWLSVLGGSVAMLTAMKLVRHKTRHKKFMIGIPVIIALQITVLIIIKIFIDK